MNNIKILLNSDEDPRRSEEIWVGKGDFVYANEGAVEFGFTEGKKYEILGIEGYEYLIIKNEKGKIDSYTPEYFCKYEPIVL